MSTKRQGRESHSRIVETLKAEMFDGTLTPGQRLGEAALAERFSVSRGPVRDALSRLVDIGIAVSAPNVGTRVREFTLADAQDLYELRGALEAETTRLATMRITDEQRPGLVALAGIEENRFAPGGRLEADNDFHLELARLSGNKALLRLLFEQLYPQLMLLRHQSRSTSGRLSRALNEHIGIAQAVVEGDALLAALLMRQHVRNSWKSYCERVSHAPKDLNHTQTE